MISRHNKNGVGLCLLYITAFHDQHSLLVFFLPPLAQLERARSFYLCGSRFESSMADHCIASFLIKYFSHQPVTKMARLSSQ